MRTQAGGSVELDRHCGIHLPEACDEAVLVARRDDERGARAGKKQLDAARGGSRGSDPRAR